MDAPSPTVHPTAMIDGDVDLASSVVVGPGVVITGPVRIAAGCVLGPCVQLRGPLVLGSRNRLHPFVCLGEDPQDRKFDPERAGAGLRIGDDNVFREYVTVHRATSEAMPTRIGSRNLFMVNAHVGHDCRIGDDCTITNNTMFAGHVTVQDRVLTGGGAAVGQHLVVGRLAFLGASFGQNVHVPPFLVTREQNGLSGVNVVGLRRAGMPRSEIDAVRWAFRVICFEHRGRAAAIARLDERAAESNAVREMRDFLASIRGPIGRAVRRDESD